MVLVRQGLVGGNQQLFQAFLSRADVSEWTDVVAHPLFGSCAPEGGAGATGMLQKWGRLRLRHIRDIREVCQAHLGETQGGGVAVNEFEHPASGAILGQQGPFGTGPVRER